MRDRGGVMLARCVWTDNVKLQLVDALSVHAIHLLSHDVWPSDSPSRGTLHVTSRDQEFC
jgi:hypothetical protein